MNTLSVHCDSLLPLITLALTVGLLELNWMFQCSGHPDIKACPPTPSRLFPVLPGREVGMDVQTRWRIKHY